MFVERSVYCITYLAKPKVKNVFDLINRPPTWLDATLASTIGDPTRNGTMVTSD